MRKKQEKKDYERPECVVHKMETETFICTSVTLDTPNSSEDWWDADEDIDGGELSDI